MTELYQVDEKYLIDSEEEKKWWIFGEYRKIEIKVIFHLWQIYIELQEEYHKDEYLIYINMIK